MIPDQLRSDLHGIEPIPDEDEDSTDIRLLAGADVSSSVDTQNRP